VAAIGAHFPANYNRKECAIHAFRNGGDATGVRSREIQAAVIKAARAPTRALFEELMKEEVRVLGLGKQNDDGKSSGDLIADFLEVCAVAGVCVCTIRSLTAHCRRRRGATTSGVASWTTATRTRTRQTTLNALRT